MGGVLEGGAQFIQPLDLVGSANSWVTDIYHDMTHDNHTTYTSESVSCYHCPSSYRA